MSESPTTIAAAATPPVKSAVAVIRVSGPDARRLGGAVFPALEKAEPGRMVSGRLLAGSVTDYAMAVYFPAPKTFTGEETVELYPHGSAAVVAAALDALYRLGAKPAAAGEFTMRAFLNGKLDLTQAEGIADLIDAETEAEAKSAYGLLEGGLRREIDALYDGAVAVLAQIEVEIDYPEEHEGGGVRPVQELNALVAAAERLKDSYRTGRMLHRGVRVAIVGEPNVGKSTLLNALLGFDRAIVSDTPGTTRDTVEDSCLYRGVRFILTDTAGIRDTQDPLEHEGIKRARLAADTADAVLSLSASEAPAVPISPKSGQVVIHVRTKADLNAGKAGCGGDALSVSAKTGEGLAALREQLYALTVGGEAGRSAVRLINERQVREVADALTALNAALNAVTTGLAPELAALELASALNALGRITGRRAADEVIDQIFSRFCVGK